MVDKSGPWTLSLITSNAAQQSLKGEAAGRTNQSPAERCLGVTEAGRGGGARRSRKSPEHTLSGPAGALITGPLANEREAAGQSQSPLNKEWLPYFKIFWQIFFFNQ